MRLYFVRLVLWYLRFWARIAIRVGNPYIIGIAGSVGKSSTRNALYAVLKDYYPTKVVSGNSETGVPLGILGLPIDGFSKKDWVKRFLKAPTRIFFLRNVKYLVVEMGIDDPYPPKNMSYLLTILKPDMAIDLNATATHTEQFEKLLTRNVKDPVDFLVRKIAFEDSKIISNGHTGIGIFNRDDKNLSDALSKVNKNNLKLLTFGKDLNNNISYIDYSITTGKTKYVYNVQLDNKIKSFDLVFPGMLLSQASRESFASVILAGLEIGLNLTSIKDSLESNFTIPKGRSSLFNGIKKSLIIDSSYNSSKSSVLAFLDVLKLLKARTKRPIVFLMGDMRELGREAKAEHEEVASEIVKVVDELYCVGPQTLEYVIPIVKEAFARKRKKRKVIWYKNAVQAGLHLKEELPANAILLVKGSQNTIYLEEAIKFLLENSNDIKKLARQEAYWTKIKQEFFSI